MLSVLLGACATPRSDLINTPPPVDLSVAEVRADVSTHVGQRVRWGGSVAGVENRANETWLEIVSRPLDSYGRPRPSDESSGRFIAEVKGFLDPAVYAHGRLVTVAGVVRGGLTRSIGKYPYTYVAVEAEAIKLWEQPSQPSYYPYRYYDPWYDPFWPTRPFPWYAPYPLYPYW
jgi:outer membrane lipoprotein